MVSTAFLSYLLLDLNSITLGALGLIKWFCHIHVWFYYPLALSHGVCGISIFFFGPYCTNTPAQLIVICLVLLLPLCHVGSIWWSCLRYMWILCPLAPSHGICGMSTSADLCIPCHIFIVLWQSCCGHVWFIYPMALSHGVHCISVILAPSIQSLLVLLDRLSGFAIFTCGFIIFWHRPMVYVASPSSLSILHHHPCSLCPL